MLPAFTFPIGLIARRQEGRTDTHIFLEVLQQKDEIANLEVLPEGDYLCQQKPPQVLKQMDMLISEYFAQHPKANQVIITNLTSAYFDRKGPVLELQEPV